MPATTPVPTCTVGPDVESKLRAQLTDLYKSTPCMPIMVRLAWHDAGTYDKESKTGGANGSIRFTPEASHGANAGLKIAHDLLAPIKEAHPDISYADLYQLASVVGIKYASGPDIPFRFGRVDAVETDCTPDGRLPDANKRMPHLRDIFHRMGFSDAEIVTLSGAHALGRGHKDRSGFEGAWTEKPLVFDNAYYKELLKDEPGAGILRMVSDAALSDEPELKKQVEKYAEDQEAFFKDYVAAHVKLSELGMAPAN